MHKLNVCEGRCNRYEWCIGYSYEEVENICWLFQSKEVLCPELYHTFPGVTVASIDQLAGKSKPGQGGNFNGCFGKLTGKATIWIVIYAP